MESIVVTGANRGIGLELVRQYVNRGDHVYAVCRRSNEVLDATGADIIDNIDVTSASSVKRLADCLNDIQIDRLVNNAGVLDSNSLGQIDYAQVQRQFDVNAVAPLRVTEALLPVLQQGSKVVIITSRMGSIADNSSGGSYGYRMSKAAVNMAAKSLSIDLAGKGVAVAVLHPGYVATDMTNHQGPVSPAESARGLLQRMDELDMSSTGSFRHAQGDELPW